MLLTEKIRRHVAGKLPPELWYIRMSLPIVARVLARALLVEDGVKFKRGKFSSVSLPSGETQP